MKVRDSLILFPKPLWWMCLNSRSGLLCFAFNTGKMCCIDTLSLCACGSQSEDNLEESVRLLPGQTQGSNPLSWGLAAGVYTLDQLPCPQNMSVVIEGGTGSDCYFVMLPSWFPIHHVPASSSQVAGTTGLYRHPWPQDCYFVLWECGYKPQSCTRPVASVPLEV